MLDVCTTGDTAHSVWQQLEYVCRVTRGAHIEHL